MSSKNSNLKLNIQAVLEKVKSSVNIKAGIKAIEAKLPKIKVQGTLNSTATRKELNTKLKTITPKIKVDADTSKAAQKIKKLGKQKEDTTIQPTVDHSQAVSGLKEMQKETKSLFDRFLSGAVGANLIRMSVQNVIQAIHQAIAGVKELDTLKTNIQMASKASDFDANSMMSNYNLMAKELSTTTKSVAEAANEFLRMGESVETTNELIKSSQVLAKTGMIESSDAAGFIVSSLKGYQLEAKDSIDVVSKLTAVDLEAAVSAGGLAEALSQCADIANHSGTSMDRLIGYAAAMGETTKESMSVVGNSMKSIYSRLSDLKIGKFVDDETGESLSDTEAVLNKLGIQLRDTQNVYRDFDDVLSDIGARWNYFTQAEQNEISVAMAGTVQKERFLALMNNWTNALQYSEAAADSAGLALERYGVYQDSIEAKTNELTAALESLSTSTVSEELYTGILEAATGIVEFLDKTNLLKGALTGLIAVGVSKAFLSIGVGIMTAVKSTAKLTKAMALFDKGKSTENLKAIGVACKGLSKRQLKLVLSTKGLDEAQRLAILSGMGVEKQELRQTLTTLGFAAAEDKAAFSTAGLRNAIKSLGASLEALVAAHPILASIAALGTIVFGTVKAYDALHVSAKEAKEKTEELMSSYKTAMETADSHKETIHSLGGRYEELSKGVNHLGENVSLTADEYSEYKDICGKIADMFPAMVQGYTSEGDAILKLKGNVDELTEAYETEAQAAYNALIATGKDSDGNVIITDWKYSLSEDKGKGTNITQAIKELQAFMTSDMDAEMYTSLREQASLGFYDGMTDAEKLIAGSEFIPFKLELDLDEDGIITDEELAKAKDSAKILLQTYQAEIESDFSNVKTLANAYLFTNSDYKKLDEQSRAAASLLLNSIPAASDIAQVLMTGTQAEIGEYVAFIVQALSSDNQEVSNALINLLTLDTENLSPDEIQSFVNSCISTIAVYLHEDENELKIRLGFEAVDETAKQYEEAISKFGEDSKDTIVEFFKDKSINDSEEIAYWNEVTEGAETAAEAVEIYNNAKSESDLVPLSFTVFTEEQSKSIDDFQSKIKTLGDALSSIRSGDTSGLTDLIQEFPELAGQSDNLEQGIQQLIYNSLQELYDTFGNGLPTEVKDDLQSVADAASGVAPSLHTAFAAIQKSYQAMNEFKGAMDGGKLTDSVLSSVGALSTTLNDMVAGFYADTVSADQLYQALTEHYNTDLKNYGNALIAKNQFSESFYNAAGLSSAAVTNQFNKDYGIDIQNCKNYNQAKLEIEAKTLGKISEMWSKYYDAQSMTYKPELELLKQSAMNGNAQAQKDYAQVMQYTTAHKNGMNALNKILYEGIGSSFDERNNKVDGNGGENKNGSSSAKAETKETFNFIETAIKRIETAIDKVKSKAEDTFRSFSSRSKSYAEAMKMITDEINLQEQAKQKYIERRDSIGLDEYWAAQVRDGSLNIADITDDDLKESINKYGEWNDKALECTETIANLKKEQKELARESIELLITKYEKLAAKASNAVEKTQNKIDLKEAWGGSASIKDYRSMNKSVSKQIGYLKDQNAELKKQQKAVPRTSEAWYDYQEQMDSNSSSIQNLTKNMAENAQAAASLAKANADSKVAKYDSKDELYEAKIDNAATSKSKNSFVNKIISNIGSRQKAYDIAVTSSTKKLNSSASAISGLKSKKTNTKNKAANAENKAYNAVLKKVKAQIKTGKRIGESLLTDTTELNDNLALYHACVKYNAYFDAKAENEMIAEIYAETSKREKADLALQKFNNIAAEYDYAASQNEQKKTELNNKISIAEAQGRKVSIAYYNGLISAESGEQKKLIDKRNALQKSLDDAVTSGEIEKGSKEWYEMVEAVNEVKNAIDESVQSVVELNKTIRQIRWDTFDDSLETIKRINGESEFYISLMDKNKKLIDEETGNFTEFGNAALGLRMVDYKNYLAQADAYTREYDNLMKQIESGEESLDDEKVVQRLRELQDAQRDAKLSAEDTLTVIKDLMKQGYDAQLESLSKLIQKYKDLKQSEKDAYEYQRTITEKTKSIAALQKQLAAYGTNDTEEARAKIQQIKVDLEAARQDLKETEYEKYLSDTNDMLDELYNNYENFMDGKLNNVEELLDTINSSIGGLSFNIIATLASLNGGITPELEKLLNGSMSSSDYVNSVIAADKAKQEASVRQAAEAEEKEKAEAAVKAQTEAFAKEKAEAEAKEAEKKKAEREEKVNELNRQLSVERDNIDQLTKSLSAKEKDALKELNAQNKKRMKKGLKLLTLSDLPDYVKARRQIEKEIAKSKDKIESLERQRRNLDRNPLYESLHGFAKGIRSIPHDQLAWTQEKGDEIIFRKSDGAMLTPLAQGDMVFDSEMTKRLWEISQMNPELLMNSVNFTPAMPKMPELPVFEQNFTGGDVNVSIDEVNLPNVTNYREFRDELLRDNTFGRAMKETTVGALSGRSNSLDRFKYVR